MASVFFEARLLSNWVWLNSYECGMPFGYTVCTVPRLHSVQRHVSSRAPNLLYSERDLSLDSRRIASAPQYGHPSPGQRASFDSKSATRFSSAAILSGAIFNCSHVWRSKYSQIGNSTFASPIWILLLRIKDRRMGLLCASRMRLRGVEERQYPGNAHRDQRRAERNGQAGPIFR